MKTWLGAQTIDSRHARSCCMPWRKSLYCTNDPLFGRAGAVAELNSRQLQTIGADDVQAAAAVGEAVVHKVGHT